jgi:hypothetical protein
MTLQDVSASADGTGVAQAVGGEYGVLYDASKAPRFNNGDGVDAAFGVVFYQAGIVALTASLWDKGYAGNPGWISASSAMSCSFQSGSAYGLGEADTSRNIYETFVSSSISGTWHQTYQLHMLQLLVCTAPTTSF